MDYRLPPARWGRFQLDVTDASPPSARSFWRGASQAATIGIFVLLFIALLSFARAILLPVAFAFLLGTMLVPVARWARQYRVPSWASAVVLVLALGGALSFVLVLLADPVRDLIARGPEIGALLTEKLQIIGRPLAALDEWRQALSGPNAAGQSIRVDGGRSLLEPLLAVLTPAIGQLVLFVATLFFFLAGHDRLRQSIVGAAGERTERLRLFRILNDLEQNLPRYLGVVTVINSGVGTMVALIAFLAGLPNPVVWGVVAFLLNYVPYIGPATMTVILFGIGLISMPTLASALVAPAAYLVLVTAEGNFLTPGIIGRQLTLNPLLIILSVAFWAWLWGPVGALLATPMLIVCLVACKHVFPTDEVKLPK